jgi:hypothetical protein
MKNGTDWNPNYVQQNQNKNKAQRKDVMNS